MLILQNMDHGELSNAFPHHQNQNPTTTTPPSLKRKRNLPGNPDPEAEVIALSPKTLMATNRFLCETCGKGFQRDQNLQLHRRGHNLPWKLKQRTNKEPKKRVYVCPEKTCVHNHPSRALGDLTGIKKHFCRKHGEKKWKCDKCSKRYAVQSDWKAHSKTCGTREYKCDCGTIFSRRDSFITHRAFCDALAEETARVNAASSINNSTLGANNNNNNIIGYNNMMIGTSMAPHHNNNNNMATQFASICNKPIPFTEEATNNQTTTRGLSLWMDHHHHHRQEATMATNNNNYHLNWVFGSKISTNPSQDLSSNTITSTTTTSLPILGSIVNVPSLYSSQHQPHQTCASSSSANMSATALLQKAAQVGATSSDPSSFLGALGLKCSNGSGQGQDGNNNKFCGVYGSSLVLTSSSNNISTEPEKNELSQMHPSKRRHVMPNEESGGGQTRDFLGVGGANHHLPPFINQSLDLI